ncbi:MAG: DUF3443 family protein, partial [Rhodoferax sp.]|uniref:DUF3443 family protein n=1 Tax=Rhodoferax sp. TaxID=50421 RepID=UPI0026023820
MPTLCARARLLLAACSVLAAVTGCGGGNSSVTTYSGGGLGSGSVASTAILDTPTGSNTTEVIVDSGPGSFSLGAANIPYVTVTVCAPNSSACVTIDHVFLDTGSYGLRVLKSSVVGLSLPPVTLAANAQLNTPGGTAVECYPFVLGDVWGPLAKAGIRMAG